jgi:hypothetical protein
METGVAKPTAKSVRLISLRSVVPRLARRQSISIGVTVAFCVCGEYLSTLRDNVWLSGSVHTDDSVKLRLGASGTLAHSEFLWTAAAMALHTLQFPPAMRCDIRRAVRTGTRETHPPRSLVFIRATVHDNTDTSHSICSLPMFGGTYCLWCTCAAGPPQNLT